MYYVSAQGVDERMINVIISSSIIVTLQTILINPVMVVGGPGGIVLVTLVFVELLLYSHY